MRFRKNPNEFTESDAWLLVTLYFDKAPMSRARVRSIADYIRRRAITEREIDEGIERLSKAGLTERREPDSFTITAQGLMFVEPVAESVNNHAIQTLLELQKLLARRTTP